MADDAQIGQRPLDPVATTGSPTQPRPRLVSVMPSCVADSSGRDASSRAGQARRQSFSLDAHRLELRFADFDKGEFRRDEERIRPDQHKDDPCLQEVMSP